jgi:NitT/TauT family transport system ATP-binding protein
VAEPSPVATVEPLRRLSVRDLVKAYGTGAAAKTVIDGLSFEVADGEFVCIVGPSGAGKTTLLKCLAGLLPPTSGGAYLDDRLIDGPPRGMALVVQEYNRSLMPWLTVRRNLELPLQALGLATPERGERMAEALTAVGLDGAEHSFPWQLSGGMQQRVAIARAIACRPEVLMMDEPFASVDAQTRADLEDLTLSLRQRFGMTVLLVTHDIDEAVYLSDRVVVLSKNPCRLQAIVDIDLPRERDQLTTKADPHFVQHRADVLSMIRSSGRAA